MNAKEYLEENRNLISSAYDWKTVAEIMESYHQSKSKEEAEKIIAIIPTNWIDPLLSGPDSPLGEHPYGGPEVEGLLLALKNRIIAAFGKEGEG